MISFFAPLFENIKTKVETLLEQAEQKVGYKAKFIFMVGGFSENRQTLSRTFQFIK